MFLLDTDTVSAIIRDKRSIGSFAKLLSEAEWGISSITLMEIVYGRDLLDDNDGRRKLISEFLRFVKVFDFNSRAAEVAGHVRSELRKTGKPIGAFDPLIAGHALALDAVLVSANTKHFSKVKNLKLVNWLK